MRCPTCHRDVPAAARFCPACGAAASDPAVATTATSLPGTATAPTATIVDAGIRSPSSPPAIPVSGTGAASEGRFVPGDVVAGRYRIVGLLGKGGMGEVYRADDLRLGRPIALKFLPEELERDPGRMKRFLNEARVALEVTHPNVCRVYDLGEADGRHYMTMEFVDGEDLASLLRRIGRMPEDRAVTVARQLCAGLAAAHGQGILHRDLKPANVMIDGRGEVKITDFGLAGLATGFHGAEVRVGTPQYMSPEQIDGREVTVRSDVYALGLTLYELFTGSPAFASDSLDELRRMHAEIRPTLPSVRIAGLDREIEAAILRCLEKSPADRPGSTLAVSAALPGGDPLAAALAAGETPSPEMVAEAGEVEGLQAPAAVALLVAAVVLFVLAAHGMAPFYLANHLPITKPPAAMVDRAEEVVVAAGYTEPLYAAPVDTAHGYSTWPDVIEAVDASTTGRGRFRALRERPDAVAFWYRQGPAPFVPDPEGRTFSSGLVRYGNPARRGPGYVEIVLDGAGRLTRLRAYPLGFRDGPPEDGPANFGPLFEKAGLDPAALEPAEPSLQHPMSTDHRLGWTGVRPDRPDVPIRVEAGSVAGRPVLFEVLAGTRAASLAEPPVPPDTRSWSLVASNARWLVTLALLIAGAVLARRNVRRGGGDTRGAARLALAIGVWTALSEALLSHALLGPFGGGMVWGILATALFYAAVVGVTYLTIEPFGRRIWPTMFVSSGRLLSRPRIRWRDPLTGRAVLAGVLAGGVYRAVVAGGLTVESLLQGNQARPVTGVFELLVGQRAAFGTVMFGVVFAVTFALLYVLFLVAARALVRRAVPAAVLAGIVWAAMLHADGVWNVWWISLAIAAVQMFVLLRFGVLALIVALSVFVLSGYAAVSDWGAWYGDAAWFAAALATAAAIYGAWAATGGRPLPAATLPPRSTGTITTA